MRVARRRAKDHGSHLAEGQHQPQGHLQLAAPTAPGGKKAVAAAVAVEPQARSCGFGSSRSVSMVASPVKALRRKPLPQLRLGWQQWRLVQRPR